MDSQIFKYTKQLSSQIYYSQCLQYLNTRYGLSVNQHGPGQIPAVILSSKFTYLACEDGSVDFQTHSKAKEVKWPPVSPTLGIYYLWILSVV